MERDLKDNTNKNYNTRSTVREVWWSAEDPVAAFRAYYYYKTIWSTVKLKKKKSFNFSFWYIGNTWRNCTATQPKPLEDFSFVMEFQVDMPADFGCRFKYMMGIYLLSFSVMSYILESNLHPFYSFRGLKNQMWIRFAVESGVLEIWCTTDNSTTFVWNLVGAFGIMSSYTATPAPFGA
jgi:hypothetical protein